MLFVVQRNKLEILRLSCAEQPGSLDLEYRPQETNIVLHLKSDDP